MQYFEQSARLSSVSIELIPNIANEPIDVSGWQPLVVAREALEGFGARFAVRGGRTHLRCDLVSDRLCSSSVYPVFSDYVL